MSCLYVHDMVSDAASDLGASVAKDATRALCCAGGACGKDGRACRGAPFSQRRTSSITHPNRTTPHSTAARIPKQTKRVVLTCGSESKYCVQHACVYTCRCWCTCRHIAWARPQERPISRRSHLLVTHAMCWRQSLSLTQQTTKSNVRAHLLEGLRPTLQFGGDFTSRCPRLRAELNAMPANHAHLEERPLDVSQHLHGARAVLDPAFDWCAAPPPLTPCPRHAEAPPQTSKCTLAPAHRRGTASTNLVAHPTHSCAAPSRRRGSRKGEKMSPRTSYSRTFH